MKAACDWSNLDGRLTGKNQPGNLQSCTRQQPVWLSVKPELCAQSDRPVWPDENLQSSTSWEVLIEVWIVAWAWLLISPGEPKFHLLGPVDPVKRHARQGVRLLRLLREQGREYWPNSSSFLRFVLSSLRESSI